MTWVPVQMGQESNSQAVCSSGVASNSTCGIPRPCGADEDVEDAAGDADLRDRLLLIHRQGVPVAVLRSGSVLDPCQRHGRRRPIIRRGKESVFCREHLLAWAPEFFAAVEEHAQTDFYRGVGILGADALTQLASQIGDPH